MEDVVTEVQDAICDAVSALDGRAFVEQRWERPGGGGGRSRLLEGGDVIEKGGVNVSIVEGDLPAEAAASMRSRVENLPENPVFHAVGISLVLHPRNPWVPAVHANFRRFAIQGGPWWYGGGADLTPNALDVADAIHFHGVWQAVCRRHAGVADHAAFKAWCDRYFFIGHRGEARGIGGIFFDDVRAETESAPLAFVTDCAGSFLDSWLPLAERHHREPVSDADRAWQLHRRSRYAEFNLVYDRGTTFGLRTGARVASVLMSLPPLCTWTGDDPTPPGDAQRALVDVLRKPVDWV